MQQPLISIIVPVYNAEKTLHRCLDSILAQTYTNFECLLINDGSKDNSGAICDEYALKDSRFKVFHKENAGVSTARNLGLDNANGEWITFVDSDDWLDGEFLEKMESNSKDVDLVVGSYYNINSEGKVETIELPEIGDSSIENYISSNLSANLFNAPWAKLFLNKIISSQNLRFRTDLRTGEDILFVVQYLCYVKKLKNSDGFYWYIALEFEKFIKKYQMSFAETANHLDLILRGYEKLNEKKVDTSERVTQVQDWFIFFAKEYETENNKFSLHGFEDCKRLFQLGGRLANHGIFNKTVNFLAEKKCYLLIFLALRFILPVIILKKKISK